MELLHNFQQIPVLIGIAACFTKPVDGFLKCLFDHVHFVSASCTVMFYTPETRSLFIGLDNGTIEVSRSIYYNNSYLL